MRFGRNLLAALASSGIGALISFAVIPLYLRYLGIAAYGLIGFYTTLQNILLILDLGLAPTMNREMARAVGAGEERGARNLLHTFAVIAWVMATAIALLVFLLGPLIGRYWLNSTSLSSTSLTQALMLMGVAIACRWPIGMYQAAATGMQRLSVASIITTGMTAFTSIGAVCVLAFISPTIEAFFIWQALAGLLYALVQRSAAWRIIGGRGRPGFDFALLKPLWGFSAGMLALTFAGLVFTQLDKIMLSRLLALEDFGHYMLASVIASSLFLIITPFYNATYPRLSLLVARNSSCAELADSYRTTTRLLATILFPFTMVLVVYPEVLIQVWTGNPPLAHVVAPIVALLVLGTAIHGVMYIPHALQLAYGNTSIPLTINYSLMVVMVPLIIFLVASYGALGGALAWLILHVLYTFLSTWLTHRRYLKDIREKWLFRDVGIPFAISAIFGLVSYFILTAWRPPAYLSMLLALATGSGAALCILAASPKLRGMVWEVARAELRKVLGNA